MADKHERQSEPDRFRPWKSRRRRALMCRVGGRMTDHAYADFLELEAKALEAYAEDLAAALEEEANDIEKHAPFAGTAIREARAQGKTMALRDVAKRLRGGK